MDFITQKKSHRMEYYFGAFRFSASRAELKEYNVWAKFGLSPKMQSAPLTNVNSNNK